MHSFHISCPTSHLKWPVHHFFFLLESGKRWCTNSKERGGLGIRIQNTNTWASKQLKYIEGWMVKPLSAGCVNNVAACWILITSDYISQTTLWSALTRNRKFTLYGFISVHLVLLPVHTTQIHQWLHPPWMPWSTPECHYVFVAFRESVTSKCTPGSEEV